MDWEDLILNRLSKNLMEQIVDEIEDKPSLFGTLYPLLFSEKKKLAWRVGWILCHLQQRLPVLIEDKLDELLVLLPKTNFSGVRRSILFLVNNSNRKEFSVDFINNCFEWMTSPKQDPAIQVYSMYCVEKVCAIYPDFKLELLAILENINSIDYSKGFNAARIKTLKKLYKNT